MSLVQTMYKLEDVADKGEGAVAALSIKHGTIIECEKPLFKIKARPTAKQTAKILQKLSKDDQRRFFELKNSYTSDPVVGIVKTNSLPLGCGSGKNGVFPKCSRFNHSCNPNCFFWWSEAKGVAIIRAVKDIMPGQGLTIFYGSDKFCFIPRFFRQRTIKDEFSFNCACEVCLLSEDALSLSEERRHALLSMEIDSRCLLFALTCPGRALGLCKQMLTLLAEEELVLGRDRLYYRAFRICLAHGDLLRARAFMTKHVAERKFLQGGDNHGLAKEEEFVRDPAKFCREYCVPRLTTWQPSEESLHSSMIPEREEWLWERAV